MMKIFLSLSSLPPKQTYMNIYTVHNNPTVKTYLYVQYVSKLTKTKLNSYTYIKILTLLCITITLDYILTYILTMDET